MKKVAVIMGSASDLPVVEKAIRTLEEYGAPYAVHVFSAHRTPDEAAQFASTARAEGFGVILAAAALSAFGIVDGPPQARESTAAILSLMLGAIWLLVITSRPLSTWKWVLLVSVISATVGGVLLEPVRHFFSMVAPSGYEWLVILCVGACAALLIEVAQRIFYARQFARSLEG